MMRTGLLAGVVALALVGFASDAPTRAGDDESGSRRERWHQLPPAEIDQIRDLLATIRQQRVGTSASVEQSATILTDSANTESINSAAVFNTAVHNEANVRQDGSGNTTTVDQNGTANSALVAQSGTSHAADVHQTGNNLSVDLGQFGDRRSIGINQFGEGTGVPLIVRQY